jgi:tellurite resistance protein TerC
VPISVWIAFHLALLLLLGFELAFSRIGLAALAGEARDRRQHRNALAATAMWLLAALALATYIHYTLGGNAGVQFLAGYALEESLSIDNLFVFLLLFKMFAIPPTFQPRALFWGVLGAILMRGAFIAAGLGLLERFSWISYLFGVVLLVASVRLVLPSNHESSNAPPRWLTWVSKIHPVSPRSDVFLTHSETGRPLITMLLLAVIAIELSDVVFALDSIPAVLSVTRQPFLAYTSNILAVMSLRSLYFLLAQALKRLRFLHFGLAAILAFAAIKMLAARWLEIAPLPSLAVIVAILAVTIALSLAGKAPDETLSKS